VLFKARLNPIVITEHIFNMREGKVFLFLMDSFEDSGRETYWDIRFMNKLKTFQRE